MALLLEHGRALSPFVKELLSDQDPSIRICAERLSLALEVSFRPSKYLLADETKISCGRPTHASWIISDEESLVTADSCGTIVEWSIPAVVPKRILSKVNGPISLLAACGSELLAVTDHAIHVINTKGTIRSTIFEITNVTSVALLPSSGRIAAGLKDGSVTLLSLDPKEVIRTQRVGKGAVKFIQPNKANWIACETGELFQMDPESLTIRNRSEISGPRILAASEQPRGDLLAILQDESFVVSLQKGGTDAGSLDVFPSLSIYLSDDQNSLYAGGIDGVVRVYDISSKKLVAKHEISRSAIRIGISPSGKYWHSLDENGVLRLFDKKGARVASKDSSRLTDPINGILPNFEKHTLTLMRGSGCLQTIDMESGDELANVPEGAFCSYLFPGKNGGASWVEDLEIKTLDPSGKITTVKNLVLSNKMRPSVDSLGAFGPYAYLPRHDTVLIGYGADVLAADSQTGTQRAIMFPASGTIVAVGAAADGSGLGIISRSGKEVFFHLFKVGKAPCSSSTNLLVRGLYVKSIKAFWTPDRVCIGPNVSYIAFSRFDGAWTCCAASDFDQESDALMNLGTGIHSMLIDGKTKTLLLGQSNGQISFFSLKDRTRLRTITVGDAPIEYMALSEDGTKLIAAPSIGAISILTRE